MNTTIPIHTPRHPRLRPASGFSWRCWSLLVAAALSTLLFGGRAAASPYEVVVRYSHGDDKVDVPLDDGVQHLPMETMSHRVEGLFLKLKADASAAVALAQLNNLSVVITVGGKELPLRSIPLGAKPDASKYYPLAKPIELKSSDRASHSLRVSVKSHFSAGYLCSVERDAVRSVGKPIKNATTELLHFLLLKPRKEKKTASPTAIKDIDPSELPFYHMLAQQGVLDGKQVLFSFCGDASRKVDWAKLAKKQGGKQTGEEVKRKHKRALAGKVREAMSRRFGVNVRDAASDKQPLKTAFITQDYSATLINSMARRLTLFEDVVHDDNRVKRIVDQGSVLLVQPSGDLCDRSSCRAIVGNMRATIDGKDASGNEFEDEFKITDQGRHWKVEANLSKYLLRGVTLTLWLKTGKFEQRVDSYQLNVENLGMVTSFPLISELVTLASSPTVADRDLEFKSSIPLSWAYNLDKSEGRLAAVTFPWMIGFNPRAEPRLADIVKFYPHLTVLLPLAGGAETGIDATSEPGQAQLLVGAGVSLVNAFSIGYGISLTGDANANFMMVGVSAPDLVKLFESSDD